MTKKLDGHKVAVLAADGVEQVELVEPRRAVEQAGATTELLSIAEADIQAVGKDITMAGKFPVDKLVSQASPDDYDALILPGGGADPDNLRVDRDAVDFVKAFVGSGKPIGVICHEPSALVEAGVVRGRMLTSYPGVSSRNPHDLPAFCREIVTEFAKAA